MELLYFVAVGLLSAHDNKMETNIPTMIFALLLIFGCSECFLSDVLPLVVTTWPYEDAVNTGNTSFVNLCSWIIRLNDEKILICIMF